MTRRSYTKRKEVELALLVTELTERRFGLVVQGVLLTIVVISAIAVIACALMGYAWRVPSFAATPGVAATTALVARNARGRSRRDGT